ncbi:unnamed protein product [Adineta steineri]|uniref:Uncharacterized protein n=1 Tax=Adineta steineri TaxID=433720 RepID=A0A814HY17_9BILA|nr:unnamed protein product [Adineta steineri]CAF1033947.1 unnamed protein product [Adineta steineri]CAF1119361.1 unnamed protein product [Adineta steineri]CAF3966355.1 unnamed protein product [Adineta steineri]CAF4075644.1 unnamed protein product [Adineta steineri]
MHNEAMVVAAMCENSKIYRANKFPLQTNLYNLVVARSSYGKSSILNLVRKAIDVVVFRPLNFKSAAKNGEQNMVAGLLSSFNDSTCFLRIDEADLVLKKMGYTLLPPGVRDWSTNDCRSQLLTLYDRPHNFTRRLKYETIEVFDAKFNVLASGSMADVLLERTVSWPLDGDVI